MKVCRMNTFSLKSQIRLNFELCSHYKSKINFETGFSKKKKKSQFLNLYANADLNHSGMLSPGLTSSPIGS